LEIKMMKKNQFWNYAGAVVLLLIVGIAVGCKGKKNVSEQTNAIPVEVTVATASPIERVIELSGTIDPMAKSNLGSQISGRVDKIYVKEGDHVTEGQLLVQMNDAQLTQAKVQYELADLNYKRLLALSREGAVSQQQLDQAKTAYEAAKSSYELLLTNTQLRAPFSGVVTAKLLNEGEIFALFPGAAGSPAILTLMNISTVKIMVNVPEKDVPRVKLGQRAVIRVDTYPGKLFEGKVTRIDPALNPVTHTFLVEIRVPNPRSELRPGMYAKVNLFVGKSSGILLPIDAVIRVPGSNIQYVYTVEGALARRREVTTGQIVGSTVEVTSGIKVGDEVVTVGQTRLKDGSHVTIANSIQ